MRIVASYERCNRCKRKRIHKKKNNRSELLRKSKTKFTVANRYAQMHRLCELFQTSTEPNTATLIDLIWKVNMLYIYSYVFIKDFLQQVQIFIDT